MDEQFEYREDDIQTENLDPQQTQKPPGLDRNRKIAVVVLVFLGFFMLASWSKGLHYKLNDPFTYKGPDDEEIVKPEEEDSEVALRTKDTDGDNLSDWDEINIYNTSPYLEDSDSDGFSDFEEVMTENNPTCSGASCTSNSSPLSDSSAESLPGNKEESLAELLGGSSYSNEEIVAIREIFIETGYDKDKLDQISDDDLYQIYLTTIQSEVVNGSITQGEVQNLSGHEINSIREAFLETGYDKEQLDQISDEDLLRIYNESLREYSNNQ